MHVEKSTTSAEVAPSAPVGAGEAESAELTPLEVRLQQELQEASTYLDEEGRELVERAFLFAVRAHSGQFRLSGEPYISHLTAVALILAKYKLDATTLATALMHDLIEEKTGVTLEVIGEKFGAEQAQLIDGVTRLTALFSRQEHEVRRQGSSSLALKEMAMENLRKIFLSMARDLRVILVKFADRLHNLRTLEYCEPAVQRAIAMESLDIFAPLASRLGIWEFKAELENLAFRYAYPQAYGQLTQELDRLRPTLVEAMDIVVETLKKRLEELHIQNELEYRFKHLYSVYRKTVRTHKSLAEIYDLAAIRIIVPTIEDCYMIFGLVHSLWSPLPGRIKDYIARPKPNNYRCLHTTVLGPNGVPLEIQIRTFEMHRINEVGVAAHWAYKEGKATPGKGGKNLFAQLYPWIRALLAWQGEGTEEQEGQLQDHLQVDLWSREVLAFTPRGDVVDLPVGSTPIDFAYRIHTEVGHRCVGAIVNGKMVPLTYKLANADVVEIQTSKNGTPSRDWLRICASHQALSKIRAWFKRERREENIGRGREALKAELKRLKLEELGADEELMLKAAQQLSFVSADDLLASIGYGETSPLQAVSRLQSLRPRPEVEVQVPEVAAPPRRSTPGREVIVQGIDTILTKTARCCTPVPGDEIVGYVTVGSGVSVHRQECSNFQHLAEQHPERVVNCQWNVHNTNQPKTYAVQLVVEAWDRHGLVADLLSALADIRLPVKSCQATSFGEQARVKITAEVTGNKQLDEGLKRLRGVRSVLQASRDKGK